MEEKTMLEKLKEKLKNRYTDLVNDFDNAPKEEIWDAKNDIYDFVRSNNRYPNPISNDEKEVLLAYKFLILKKMKDRADKDEKYRAKIAKFDISNSFFADLDYIISNGKSRNPDDKNLDKDESLAADGKSLLANNYLEAKKEIIKKIITLYSEIEKMEKDISDKKEEIKELREQYKQNEEKMSVLIDGLNAEDDIKKIL